MQIPFTVSQNSKYYLFARVNCPSADDDSFWVKIDDGEFKAANGLRTTGWDWVQLANTELKAGEHTLTLTYREDGAWIDKIGITTYVYGPTELGAEAVNIRNTMARWILIRCRPSGSSSACGFQRARPKGVAQQFGSLRPAVFPVRTGNDSRTSTSHPASARPASSSPFLSPW